MKMVAMALVALVALLHVWFMVLEMFLVRTPLGRKVFQLREEPDPLLVTVLANQGLYNGFLAAGLVWALLTPGVELEYFFLGCVFVAGVYGALSASPAILLVQALPALLALAAVWWGARGG